MKRSRPGLSRRAHALEPQLTPLHPLINEAFPFLLNPTPSHSIGSNDPEQKGHLLGTNLGGSVTQSFISRSKLKARSQEIMNDTVYGDLPPGQKKTPKMDLEGRFLVGWWVGNREVQVFERIM